jgi:hypothetical protein
VLVILNFLKEYLLFLIGLPILFVLYAVIIGAGEIIGYLFGFSVLAYPIAWVICEIWKYFAENRKIG